MQHVTAIRNTDRGTREHPNTAGCRGVVGGGHDQSGGANATTTIELTYFAHPRILNNSRVRRTQKKSLNKQTNSRPAGRPVMTSGHTRTDQGSEMQRVDRVPVKLDQSMQGRAAVWPREGTKKGNSAWMHFIRLFVIDLEQGIRSTINFIHLPRLPLSRYCTRSPPKTRSKCLPQRMLTKV